MAKDITIAYHESDDGSKSWQICKDEQLVDVSEVNDVIEDITRLFRDLTGSLKKDKVADRKAVAEKLLLNQLSLLTEEIKQDKLSFNEIADDFDTLFDLENDWIEAWCAYDAFRKDVD